MEMIMVICWWANLYQRNQREHDIPMVNGRLRCYYVGLHRKCSRFYNGRTLHDLPSPTACLEVNVVTGS